jgi:hypothetical protein
VRQIAYAAGARCRAVGSTSKTGSNFGSYNRAMGSYL